MKNTTKHAGVVAAVLTAAGLAGACPGTAFADTTPGHAPGGPVVGGTHEGGGHDGGGPIGVHAPILDRGPGWHGDNDWRDNGRHGDGDDWNRGRGDDWNRGWDDDGPIVVRGPILVPRPVVVEHVVSDVTVADPDSQNGTICGVDGDNVVVRGANGATWTWTTGASTRFRISGVVGTLADLKVGDQILVTGNARNAEEIVAVGALRVQPRHECAPVLRGRFILGDRDEHCARPLIRRGFDDRFGDRFGDRFNNHHEHNNNNHHGGNGHHEGGRH